MIEAVLEWLRDGGSSAAADLFSECTLQTHYVDTLFEMTGDREFELVDVDIGASRAVVEDKSGEYAQLKEEIENAIQECAYAIQWHVRKVAWTPRVPLREAGGSANSHVSAPFVDPERIAQLSQISSQKFDLTRLIAYCKELNGAYSSEHYLSVAMLTRAILDHVPPIFNYSTFKEVANSYGGSRSFKASMTHLESSSRKIADSWLHTQIRSKETLRTRTQVNFSNDLDVLLAELIRLTR